MDRRHLRDVDRLHEQATELAAAWGATAAAATTAGQERAILRLFGVNGVDRSGRPLAAEVVDRYLAADPRRLAAGVALPFAMAMAEFDLGPQDLAVEVAAGTIDLALEAELLAESDRRAVAVADATALSRAAIERIDANRLARRELVDLLGDPEQPWIGTSLDEPAIVDALDEAAMAMTAGIELLRVEVPAGRELVDRVERVGGMPVRWHPGPASRSGLEVPDPDGTPVPTGSQRALAVLRRVVDEAAAERRGYVRLATHSAALAAPEEAIVAGFERIDLVFDDPMREIVSGRVDPARSLADHAFAHRILARAGTLVLVGAGPLVVGPDLARGIPSDSATRAGRALALQALAVGLAARDGIPADRLVLDTIPDWVTDERSPALVAAAGLALRRRLFPGHSLAFVEPAAKDRSGETWGAVVGALLPDAGRVTLVLRRPGPGLPGRARATRAAARVARELASAHGDRGLTGPTLDRARAVLRAAIRTLDELADRGWPAVLGDTPDQEVPGRIGAEAVAARTDAFDPLDVGLGPEAG